MIDELAEDYVARRGTASTSNDIDDIAAEFDNPYGHGTRTRRAMSAHRQVTYCHMYINANDTMGTRTGHCRSLVCKKLPRLIAGVHRT